MKLLTKTLAGAAIGAGLLAASAVNASAAIACSGNVCWHTHEVYAYPPQAKIIVHDDGWKWAPSDHYQDAEKVVLRGGWSVILCMCLIPLI